MIKKLIVILVLAAAGYVGYLVWNNMTANEKEKVKEKASAVVEKGKDVARKAADKITSEIREDKPAPAESEVKPTVPGQPGKIVFPGK